MNGKRLRAAIWHPYKGLWNKAVINAATRPTKTLNHLVVASVVALDTAVLFLRAVVRRARLADFSPELPAAYRSAPYIFLANIGPELQLHVLDALAAEVPLGGAQRTAHDPGRDGRGRGRDGRGGDYHGAGVGVDRRRAGCFVQLGVIASERRC